MGRWKVLLVCAGLLALVSCGGGGGSDDKTVTTVQIEDPDLSEVLSTTTSTTTTTTSEVTTTLSPADIYQQINEEVRRACNEAVQSGQPAKPEFDPSWQPLSSPSELAATVQDCITKAAGPTTTTIPGGTPADGGE